MKSTMFVVNIDEFVLIRCSMLQITYLHGAYDADEGFISLNKAVSKFEHETKGEDHLTRRLFYLALPPSVYPVVSKQIRKHCMNQCTLSYIPYLALNSSLSLYPAKRFRFTF